MKVICGSSPRKKTSPLPISIRFPPKFQKFFSPYLLIIFLQNSPPPLIQNKGGSTDNKHSVVLYLLSILVYVYMSTMYFFRTEGHLTCLATLFKKLASKILDLLFRRLYWFWIQIYWFTVHWIPFRRSNWLSFNSHSECQLCTTTPI